VTEFVESIGTTGRPRDSAVPRPRPWGVVMSIAWVALAFEFFLDRACDYVFALPAVKAFVDDSRAWHSVELLVAWAVTLLVIIVAVLLKRWPVAAYLNWFKPRGRDLAFGIAVIVIWCLLSRTVLRYFMTGDAFGVADYRAAVAAGTSPSWYVLQWWPIYICSPFVEETALRGFMWRGIEYRAGRVAALVVTSLYFAGMHYGYYIKGTEIDPFGFVDYLITAFLLGWLRWRSGTSTVSIVAHCIDNMWVYLPAVIASAFVA